MYRHPIDMSPPQPKMPLEPPKFTVPDVTLMLENDDDSLFMRPGMTIPLRATPDQKVRNVYHDQGITGVDNAHNHLPHRNPTEVQKYTSKLASDNGIKPTERKISTNIPDNSNDKYKPSKGHLSWEQQLSASKQNNINKFMHSPPVYTNKTKNSPHTIAANCNPGGHGLQLVNYISEDEVTQTNTKYVSDSNDYYDKEKFAASPKMAPETDADRYHTEKFADYKPTYRYIESPKNFGKEKNVRFANNSDITMEHAGPNVAKNSPVPSPHNNLIDSDNHHVSKLYNIIQSQTEQISHLHKLLEMALEHRQASEPLDKYREPSPVKQSVSTQTKSVARPMMRSIGTGTELTIREVNSLVEYRSKKASISDGGNKHIEIENDTVAPVNRSPPANDLPPESCNPRDVSFYDGDINYNRPENDYNCPQENQCTCCAPRPQEEESCKTLQNNFMINIQQVLQHREYGPDRIPYANPNNNQLPNNHMEVRTVEQMKRQLMIYEKSTLADRNVGLQHQRTRNCNQNAFRGEPNPGQRNLRLHLTDGELAAIAASKGRIELE